MEVPSGIQGKAPVSYRGDKVLQKLKHIYNFCRKNWTRLITFLVNGVSRNVNHDFSMKAHQLAEGVHVRQKILIGFIKSSQVTLVGDDADIAVYDNV